ncbi:hypothetical protein Are01nite_86990 [Actinoplanes regularis]|nr:hypothetical protein Are01nite_86990 [Actinoplanes regularis]
MVALVAQAVASLLGFVEEFGAGVAVAVMSGCDRTTEQKRAVDRQVVISRLAESSVHALGCTAGVASCGAVMAAIHQGVGDDPGAEADHQWDLGLLSGLHAAVRGKPGQSLVALFEQGGGGEASGVKIGQSRRSSEPPSPRVSKSSIDALDDVQARSTRRHQDVPDLPRQKVGPPKDVQRALRPASPSITLEAYVHFWPRRERRRGVVGEALKAAAAGRWDLG